MANGQKVKSLGEIVESIAKMLLWLGLAFIVAASYKLGQRNAFQVLGTSLGNIVRVITGQPPPPVQAAPLPGPPVKTFNAYVVLVGAYASRDEANAMRKRLSASRIASTVSVQAGQFCVVVGPFANQRSANQNLAAVQRAGFPAQLITPTRA